MSTERITRILPVKIDGEERRVGDERRLVCTNHWPWDSHLDLQFADGPVLTVSASDLLEAIKATSRGY